MKGEDTCRTTGQPGRAACCACRRRPKATLTGFQAGSGRGQGAKGVAPAPSPTGRAARGRWWRRACREHVHPGLGTPLPVWPAGGCSAPHSPQLVLVIAQAHGQEGAAPELQQPSVQLLGHKVEPTERRRLALTRAPGGGRREAPSWLRRVEGPKSSWGHFAAP